MKLNWLTIIVAFIQGVAFWPLLKWSFLKTYIKNKEVISAIFAAIVSCFAISVLLIVPIIVLKIVLNKQSLGDFQTYTLIFIFGIVSYRIFDFLIHKRKKV
jgi:hypothetical protein